MSDKVKITIDGTPHEVKAGQNVLQAMIDLGILMPHFCYHEAMGAVGACRLCAAMISMGEGKPARLVMTCMTRVADGMIVNMKDLGAAGFRKRVIEDLMLHHPHDCPVCDEGGECMLQDMTVLCEQQHRRDRFPKRTWRNQYLGPLINHEMNRCITCYRCVRFYRDYALGNDFGVYGVHDRMYFGRYKEGVLESEFAGNLVDVCPTGVFVDKRYRRVYSRPWDLATAHSVCVHCSVGCNMRPGARHQTLRRMKPWGNPAVNKFFICDRGRFGGEYVNSCERLMEALWQGQARPSSEVFETVVAQLKKIAEREGADAIAGIGSEHAPLEANAALTVLLKELKSKRVAWFANDRTRRCVRRAMAITASRELPVPSLPEFEKVDFILSVGGDVTQEAPMIDLALRQAIRAGAALYVISPRAGKLDAFAKAVWRTSPGSEVQALAQISGREEQNEAVSAGGAMSFGDQIALALSTAKRPVILCSTLHADEALVEAAYGFARSVGSEQRKCALAYYFMNSNTAGAALARQDESIDSVLGDVQAGKIKALVVLERDLALDLTREKQLEELVSKCELVVSIDSLASPTTRLSHAVLPCVSHYQGFGTLVNYEGRAQHFEGIALPQPVTQTSSEVLLQILEKLGAGESVRAVNYHDIYDVTTETSPALDTLSAGGEGVLLKGSSSLGQGAQAGTQSSSQGPQNGGLCSWDIYFAFGSERLSAHAEPIAELAPPPRLELSLEEAQRRNLAEGMEADFTREFGVRGMVHVNPDLAPGTLGIPVVVTRPASITPEAAR